MIGHEAAIRLLPLQPDWLLLVGFTVAILVLEFFDISLPRGDTLGVSGAINAAAVLILGPASAALTISIGTAAAFLARKSTERNTHPRVELPAIVAALVAATFMHLLLPAWPSDTIFYYGKAALIAAIYLAVELVTVQVLVSRGTSRSVVRLIHGNLVRQAPLLAAQLSASVLTVIILRYMAIWGLASVVVLLLLIRQSYAMLLDIRDTYQTTVEVLVDAAEAPDIRRRGHSERTAEVARDIGARCRLSPAELDRISYAALLHDIDAIGDDGSSVRQVCRPSEVLEGVASFHGVARVLVVFEGVSEGPVTDGELLEAYVLALATDIDAASRPELRMLHGEGAIDRLSDTVPAHVKAKAVAAAVHCGYRIPAVS